MRITHTHKITKKHLTEIWNQISLSKLHYQLIHNNQLKFSPLIGSNTFPARSFPPDGTTFSQVTLGDKASNVIAPYSYWNMQFYHSEAAYIRFELGLPRGSSLGLYGRRNALPTHTHHDMMHVVSGYKSRTTRASTVSTLFCWISCSLFQY